MRASTLGAGTFDALRAQVRGSPQSRREHRMHAVLLVAGGLSCRGAARLLGDSPRAVEYWVRRYRANNETGLVDRRPPGRPSRLSVARMAELRAAVSAAPEASSRGWTGAAVSAFAARRWGVVLGLRQAQRLLARMRRDRENSMRK